MVIDEDDVDESASGMSEGNDDDDDDDSISVNGEDQSDEEEEEEEEEEDDDPLIGRTSKRKRKSRLMRVDGFDVLRNNNYTLEDGCVTLQPLSCDCSERRNRL
jgi:hypothetical protein